MARIVAMNEHRVARAQGRSRRQPAPVYFNRGELGVLLGLYSRRVARAEWRDYAISHDPGIARFCVFRHSHEMPLFTLTKRLQSGKVLYALFEGTRKIRQSATLAEALAPLDTRPRLILGGG